MCLVLRDFVYVRCVHRSRCSGDKSDVSPVERLRDSSHVLSPHKGDNVMAVFD